MKRDDYLQAFTSGLLALSGEQAAAAQKYLEQRYELHEPRKPGVLSLGARGGEGHEVGYAEWLRVLREERPRGVRVFWGAEPVDPSLPPHMAAAFEGVQVLLFQVVTGTAVRTYQLSTLRAPEHALRPERFIELLDAQEQKELLWERARELVNESNEMNHRSIVPPGQLPEYLRGPEGADVYDFLASNLSEEIQIECVVRTIPFRIPASLEDAFARSTFVFPVDPADPPERERVFLYPERQSTTPGEVRALIHAQPFPPEDVWARADARLSASLEQAARPSTPREWPAALDGLDPETVQGVASAVCEAIRALCEEQGREPVIPEALKGSFGPDALEQKRANARGRLSSSRWYLQRNPHPWQFVFFQPLPGHTSPQTLADTAQAKARFRQALRDIEAFAVRQDSPFAEAFRLGLVFLEQDVPPGDFDPAHGQRAVEALQARGFSEQARENFLDTFAYARDMKRLHWPAEKVLGFLAVAISDVFGGMGSWNDIPVEDGEDYQQCSAELFQAMKDYSAALLSWTA